MDLYYYLIIGSILIYFYLLNKEEFKSYYDYTFNFISQMNKYLLWFHKAGYIDYKYLHYDSELLTFLYKNRDYEQISPIIYRNLVIKIIKYLKYLYENRHPDLGRGEEHMMQVLQEKSSEILNVFHSFIFSLGDEDLTDFNNLNVQLEQLLNKHYKTGPIFSANLHDLKLKEHAYYL